jgi:hypothetical protein
MTTVPIIINDGEKHPTYVGNWQRSLRVGDLFGGVGDKLKTFIV